MGDVLLPLLAAAGAVGLVALLWRVATRRLAVVAAALGAAALVASVAGPGELPGGPVVALLVVDGGLLLVVLVDRSLTLRPQRLVVRRELPAVVPLGGSAPLRWEVANPTGRPLRVQLADELAPSLGAATRRAELRVPAAGRASATTQLRPRRRGRFHPRGVAVRVHGPLGLAARQATLEVPGQLRVLPSFHSRDEAELRIRRGRVLEVGMRSAPGLGGGTEFEQLREYGPDDETRRMDWAATARTGRPIVRTYRAERNQQVVVLLDCGRVMAGQVAGVPRLEHAMDAAMALTHVASRLGDRVGLVAFGTGLRAVVPPQGGPHQLGRVVEALLDLEPELAESDYAGAVAAALTRVPRRALLVLLTDLVEATTREWLAPALPVLARRHLLVVGAVEDPEVVAWATTRPADEDGAYRKVAAVGARAERRRAAGALRALGATVVDGPPGELAPALADAYLGVKAAGRL